MTHATIFEKFMIEYDKANLTSSYPSLTDYEIATVLDKAYYALIAQKCVGNNFRRAPFESDNKAIEDIQNLITRCTVTIDASYTDKSSNEYVYNTPEEMLYYIGGTIVINKDVNNVYLVSHTIADKYKVTANNVPWIDVPVCYLEDDNIHVLVDPYVYENKVPSKYSILYVKKPNSFVADYNSKTSTFELNESMAEELVNLAIIMSLEIVESTRLESKLKTSGLES